MEICYCDKWSNIKKKPWHIISESEATINHKNGQPYTVILSSEGQPKYIVNVTNKWVSVSFFDKFFRKYLQYDFIVKENKRIFLRTIMYWEYKDNTDIELKNMIFGYQENGHIYMEQRDFKTGEIEERETEDDVSRNWDLYPEFGEYSYLCKEER